MIFPVTEVRWRLCP